MREILYHLEECVSFVSQLLRIYHNFSCECNNVVSTFWSQEMPFCVRYSFVFIAVLKLYFFHTHTKNTLTLDLPKSVIVRFALVFQINRKLFPNGRYDLYAFI